MASLATISDVRHPLIAKLSRFAPLSRAERDALARIEGAPVREVGSHEDIIAEGDTPNHVNLILSGWACRYKQLTDGRRQILGHFLPGDLCDLKIFVLRRMDHSIATISPTVIAEIPRDTIIELTDSGSHIARALWWSSLVAEAIEREWIINLGQRTAIERVGHLFCELFIRLDVVGLTDGMSCDFPLTQGELAETTGLSTVHVNRTLQDLRGQGLLSLDRRTLTIHDWGRLKALAMFTPNYLHLDEDNRGSDDGQARGSNML